MLQHLKTDETVTILKDRRADVFINMRHRRHLDRRSSLRVGTNAITFLLNGGDERIYGSLINISESGACVQLESSLKEVSRTYKINLPSIDNRRMNCQVSWIKKSRQKSNPVNYGIKFIDLKLQEKKKKNFLKI